jgi:3-keto-5-aminohexanoate cleavage enzyme
MKKLHDIAPPYPLAQFPKIIINAALTGILPSKNDTAHVPITIEEIIKDAVSCYKAGASIIHIHARDDSGNATYKKEIYAQIIESIRKLCPDVILCVSTSGRVYDDFDKRSEVLELSGEQKPDMASLTVGSLNFPKGSSINTPEMIERLALKMRGNGIIPEIEIFDTGMINALKVLLRKGVLIQPLCGNLLMGSMYSASATMFDLACMVERLPEGFHWGAAGIGRFQLTMNIAAILLGGNVRVGIEDNLYYDNDKKVLATNEMLIKRLVRLSREIGREIATAKDAREILGV